MYHYTDGGLKNVWLANGYQVIKTQFGEAIRFQDLDGLTRSICLTLTQKPARLSGIEFRYVRSAGMLLSQPALGRLLGLDGQTVARWEKSGRVPLWADKFIRLLYSAQVNGEQAIADVLERTRVVERLACERIVAKTWRGQWKSKIVDTDEAVKKDAQSSKPKTVKTRNHRAAISV